MFPYARASRYGSNSPRMFSDPQHLSPFASPIPKTAPRAAARSGIRTGGRVRVFRWIQKRARSPVGFGSPIPTTRPTCEKLWRRSSAANSFPSKPPTPFSAGSRGVTTSLGAPSAGKHLVPRTAGPHLKHGTPRSDSVGRTARALAAADQLPGPSDLSVQPGRSGACQVLVTVTTDPPVPFEES